MLHNISKRSKIVIAVIFAIAIMGVVALAVNSKLQKTADNKFKPAEVIVAVQENGDDNVTPTKAVDMTFTDPEPTGDELSVDKLVNVINVDKSGTNNTRSYVRVCIMPQLMKTDTTENIDVVLGSESFDYLNAAVIAPQLETGVFYQLDGIKLYLVENWQENWLYGGDGYFYYIPVVEPGVATEPLLSKVTMDKVYAQNLATGTWLRVTVSADSIQADGREAVDPLDRWN